MTIATSLECVTTRITDRLAQSVGSHRYHMWFDRSAKFDYDSSHHCLQVKVPNRFVADWIGRHFRRQLCEAAKHEMGYTVDLNVQVDPKSFHHSRGAAATAQQQTLHAPAGTRAATEVPTRGTVANQPLLRHRLEDFVVGSSNDLAYTAATGFVSEEHEPARTLFIHGGCGLGKTHLLQGVCNQWLERHASARVRYTTAEQFTNEFLTAMRANRVDAFRRKIRRLDLLAVDDVHFLAGKQATQQEFLHSFDAIDLGGARVVMASDSHPKMIRKLQDALISRCMRGMVVQVHLPDTATRLRIVGALAQRRGLSLLESVIEVLVERCQGSVREIEGTLTKLHALMRLAQERDPAQDGHNEVGHVLLDRLFEADRRDRAHKPVTWCALIDHVADHLNVTRQQILDRSRQRHVVLARSLTVYLARQLTSMSYPEIARAMGRTNHSTVITAVRRMENQLAQDVAVCPDDQLQPVMLTHLVEKLKHAIVSADDSPQRTQRSQRYL